MSLCLNPWGKTHHTMQSLCQNPWGKTHHITQHQLHAPHLHLVAPTLTHSLTYATPTTLPCTTATTLNHSLPAPSSRLLVCAPAQIRVHLAHAGHPIIGDDIYGACGPWIPRQALHAYYLGLTNPITGEPLRLHAPLPLDFGQALQALGLPQLEEVAGRLQECMQGLRV